jgi:hypothetical protein
MIYDGDCGEIGGMKIGRGNRSTRRKPAPAPLCPPQIPYDQTRSLQVNFGVLSQLGYVRFLPNPFQFIDHPITRRYVVLILEVS